MVANRVACIDTGGYTVSLVLDAVHEILPDEAAGKHRLIRVVDESGEDYLYPESHFVPSEVVAKTLGQGSCTLV